MLASSDLYCRAGDWHPHRCIIWRKAFQGGHLSSTLVFDGFLFSTDKSATVKVYLYFVSSTGLLLHSIIRSHTIKSHAV